jgi:hypothetical protein
MPVVGPFELGHIYRLVTLTPPQRKPREHCLTHLGGNDWSARPFAGTQEINPFQIIDWTDLGRSTGADDSRHFMNRPIPNAPTYRKHDFVRPSDPRSHYCAECGFDYDNRLHQIHT